MLLTMNSSATFTKSNLFGNFLEPGLINNKVTFAVSADLVYVQHENLQPWEMMKWEMMRNDTVLW